MLSKSFKSGKCKTSLKLAGSRIKLLKNKRDIQVKHLRRELAQLLASGQEQTARIRVEHVIREEKTMSAYDLIEIYCELIVARLPIIESQKSCPIDLKEAISSVIFASPRCADIPELLDARKHFVAKYGKEFATSALELRPDCGVSRMIVEKLSAQAPDTETKMKILTAIAKEHDVKWDPKAFEELQKPMEDLLNGSSSFIRSNKAPVESLNDNFSPVATQKETTSKILHNEKSSKPTSFNSTSHTNLSTSTSPVPPTRNESMTSDRKARGSYSSQGTTSLNEATWPMEFKDAVSAAQVAADSAERASMAARAAVELAGRGNMSRQNSNDPNGSSMHSNIGNTKPSRVSSSTLKGERSESVNMNLIKGGFLGTNEEPDKLPGGQLRGDISNPTADDMEFSTQINNVDKIVGFRDSFSMKELAGSKKKHDESDFDEENVNLNYDRSASPSSDGGALDEDTIWASSVGKNQTGNTHSFNDYAAPVFDEYSPEPNHSEGNLLDSFANKKDEVLSLSPRTTRVNSIFFSDSIDESHPITEKKVQSSKFDDHSAVTFDDSDGTSSEEDDGGRRLLHEERRSGQDSGTRGELHPSTAPKAKLLTENEEKDQLPIPSVGFKASELASGGDIDLKFGRLTGGLRNRGYNYPPYTVSSMVDSSLSSKEMAGSATSITEQTISQKEKTFMIPVMADEDKYDHESSFNTPFNPESGKGKGSGLEDTSAVGINQFPYVLENKREYRGSEPSPAKQTSRTDIDSDGDKEARDSQSNIRNRRNTNANTNIKLSRRTKGRNDVPVSTEDSDTALPQSVEEARFIHENPNLNRKPNSSAKQPMQVNKKNTEARSNPDTAATSSGNNETSNSGGGVKLQAAKSPKASHVHPRLPDYDTLAAHFQSLRSNHR